MVKIKGPKMDPFGTPHLGKTKNKENFPAQAEILNRRII